MRCPRCDHPRQPGDRECPRCGIDYAYVESKMAQTPSDTRPQAEDPKSGKAGRISSPPIQDDPHSGPPGGAAGPGPVTGKATRPCPKCGFNNDAALSECLRCGVIFAKYETYLEKKRRAEEEASRTTDGLLDSDTLKAVLEGTPLGAPPPAEIKTACPHCGQHYKIRDDQIGITTRCRKCSSIFTIEGLAEED